MVTVQQAITLIRTSVHALESESIPVDEAIGRVVAETVYAKTDFPPFHQSAMDGYAVNGVEGTEKFSIIGELKAGDSGEYVSLSAGEAVRIFTGAMLPNNTLAVVKQEDVSVQNNHLIIDKPFRHGDHIRRKGEQIQRDDLVLDKHTVLRPGTVGFLLMLGISEVKVFRKPNVFVLATGSELVKPGELPLPGQIHESNAGMLKAALQSFDFKCDTQMVRDDFSAIKEILRNAIDTHDLVLVTGGVSVGDYDFVAEVLNELKVEECFYKVKQKPGKPLFFGVKDAVSVFGMPGNPAAVLTSFYNYVLPALQIMTGRKESFLLEKKAKLKNDVDKSATLSLFLKGKTIGEEVEVMEAQSSAMLRAFVQADCLISLPEGITTFKKGEVVKLIMLPTV